MNQNGEPTIGDVLDAVSTLSTHMDERFEAVDQRFEAVDQRFEAVDQRFESIDRRFDAVDKRFNNLETDVSDIKRRLAYIENEVRSLSANMITKQYLDAKIDEILAAQQKDSLFKRTLLLALEQSKVLSPETRARLETLIP